MTNYLDNLGKTVDIIRGLFPDLPIVWETHRYGGQIHVFFIHPSDAAQLAAIWENLTSAIAGKFQTQLETEYEIWNIYLFYIMKSPVSPQVKYQIENDTFSSRKIIVEKEQPTSEILADHIFNSNLHAGEVPAESLSFTDSFEFDPTIFNIVSGKVLKTKKRTSEADSSFDKLVKSLKEKL